MHIRQCKLCGCLWNRHRSYLVRCWGFCHLLVVQRKEVLRNYGNHVFCIATFAFVWKSVRKMDKDCLNRACKEIRKKGQASSREFLIYFITSIISMLTAIVFCFLAQSKAFVDSYETSSSSITTRIEKSPREASGVIVVGRVTRRVVQTIPVDGQNRTTGLLYIQRRAVAIQGTYASHQADAENSGRLEKNSPTSYKTVLTLLKNFVKLVSRNTLSVLHGNNKLTLQDNAKQIDNILPEVDKPIELLYKEEKMNEDSVQDMEGLKTTST
eukprot:TRINITY_DN3192_c0_g10_i2.p1 TRINITY_DN3192_c0_g10~~TRINITY_DN3192_c0_g10_i2.p1  ORF type:complete len:269 (-),score=3.67 TRINITY_DN3192_c0_g10_i2:105-911(-)